MPVSEKMTDIVGHKTLADGRHVPLERWEADALLEAAEKQKLQRAERMPDEQAAIKTLFDAWLRLKELGWSNPIYCPKDGSAFQVIEAGSTGIFRCTYQGKWPEGSWWVEDGGDLYPSRPMLFRLYPEDEAKRKAKMEEASARYAAGRAKLEGDRHDRT